MGSFIDRGENLTSEEWFCELQETESEDQIGSFLVGLWYIWDQRNCHLGNKKKLEEWEILPRASDWLQDYLAKQMKPELVVRTAEQKWKPPMTGSVKINVDAAVFDGQGTEWGMVVRDGVGNFLFGAVKRSRMQWNPEEAEVMAVDFGLEMARQRGIGEMEVEFNCLGVVQQLKREERRETEIGLMCEEIRIKAQMFGEEVWVTSPPQVLVPLLREDALENSDYLA